MEFIHIGPALALPGWFKTTMWPWEFTATPRTSPRFMSGEYRSGRGTDSNGISGSFCRATAGALANAVSMTTRLKFLTGTS